MSSLILSLLLAAAAPAEGAAAPATTEATKPATAARPTVRLVADEALTPWLLVRLLEDGYPLTVSPEVAQVELAITTTDEGAWRVDAVGKTAVGFDVETAADPAVMRLELLHRSLDALEDVTPREAETSEVAVGLTVVEGARPSLAPRVVADILAAGATLVPEGEEPLLEVCASQPAEDQPMSIVVLSAGHSCDDASVVAELGAEELPTTTQRVVAAMAVLSSAEEVDSHTSESEVEPAEPKEDFETPPALEPEPARPAARRTSWVIRGGPSVGLIGRLDVVDPVFAGSLMFGREPGVQGWLELQVRPVASTGDFRVVEVQPAVGLQVRPISVRRVSFFLGALLGPEIHIYNIDAALLSSRGAHTSASLEGAAGIAVRVWKQHEVQLSFRAGRSSERIHRVASEDVLRRHSSRVGASLGFMFGRSLSR